MRLRVAQYGSGTGKLRSRDERTAYQDDILFASGTVSLTTSHRRNRQAFRRTRASACRNTMRSSGWNEITKSSPSRRSTTFRLSGRLMTISPDIEAPHCLTNRFRNSRIRRARARPTQDDAFRAGVMKRQQKAPAGGLGFCMGKRLGGRLATAIQAPIESRASPRTKLPEHCGEWVDKPRDRYANCATHKLDHLASPSRFSVRSAGARLTKLSRQNFQELIH